MKEEPCTSFQLLSQIFNSLLTFAVEYELVFMIT
jgi:hypothetical protein